MKKILIGLTIALSCLGISSVKAESKEYNYDISAYTLSSSYEDFINYFNDNQSIFTELNTLVFNIYNNDYRTEYPFYILQTTFNDSSINFYLLGLPELYHYYIDSNNGNNGKFLNSSNIHFNMYESEHVSIKASYDLSLSTYTTHYYNEDTISDSDYTNEPAHYTFQSSFIENWTLSSNFDIIVNTSYDSLIINNYRDTNSSYIINDGDVFPVLFNNLEDLYTNTYTEINLNDYAYVALALKDYNKDPFETTVQVKGNYCLTPVYNYGMTERKDILTGSQVERCSPYYNTYTPVRTYITESDLKNHSIYYVKSYDTSKENYIKVDTSIFDITYFTEENKDNPYVTIDGKTYPTIPYDNLTDTATKSEDEGYVSGAVEEFSFSDIFTAPLDFLMEIWGTIATFFSLITSFISLLPPILQGFLYASFTLAIVLGLIKILL